MQAWPWLLSCAVLSAAQAQVPEPTLEPSAASGCMRPAPGASARPEYPIEEFKLRQGGRVRVKLDFATSNKPPEIEVLSHDGSRAFVDAVRQHVRGLRLPCLPPAGPVSQLVQDYEFVPDQRAIHWTHPVDLADPERIRTLACLKNVSGLAQPLYPVAARRDLTQGRVMAHLKFTAPEQAPQVTIHARPNSRVLARSVQRWAADYRLPCMTPGTSMAVQVIFSFHIEREAPFGFTNVSLHGLLRSVKDIHQQTVYFDFNTMACPFDVRLTYLQPMAANRVGEVGSTLPSRRTFLEWLGGIEIAAPDATLDAVFGDTVTFTVPCLRIDIKPKEKA